MPRALIAEQLKTKFFGLLLSLILLGLLYPIMEEFEPRTGQAIWSVAFWLVLLGALRAVGAHRRVHFASVALAAVAFTAGVLRLYFSGAGEQPWLAIPYALSNLAFLALATVTVLSDVLRGRRVTLDKIFGAVCVYLLLGLTFAYVYLLLHSTHHTTPVEPEPLEYHALADYVYFSYTTLTTLGYGDMVPHTAGAAVRVARSRHRPALPDHPGGPARRPAHLAGAALNFSASPGVRPAVAGRPHP